MVPKAVLNLACVSMVACGIMGPELDALNRAPLDPIPSEYVEWYVESQSCVGTSRDFAAISWFVADELFLGGEEKGGVWSSPNRITLRSDHLHSQRAVKHEMIHYVLQIGNSLHDTNIFDRCTLSGGGMT